jgi:hypothetical protein
VIIISGWSWKDSGIQIRRRTSWKPEKTPPVGFTLAQHDHQEIEIEKVLICSRHSFPEVMDST